MNEALVNLGKALAAAGLPILARAIGTGAAGPIGAAAASALVPVIAEALGLDRAATPDAVASAIAAEPQTAAERLAGTEQQAALDFARLQVEQNNKAMETCSWFLAGWRPAFAWLCVAWTCIALSWTFAGRELPPAFLAIWNPVWLAFGGVLGLRTVDKWLGVATKALPPILKRKG